MCARGSNRRSRLLVVVGRFMDALERKKLEEALAAGGNWVDYANGNYHVWLSLDDGTKIRHCDGGAYRASFPESMDIKITNACDRGCPQCHEGSCPDGKHAHLDQPFVDTLHPYQEIAVGGGNVLSHPDLEGFLARLRDKGCIPSITVNQRHFMDEFDRVRDLVDAGLVFGVGVSLDDATQPGFVERLREIPSAVIHTIVGILSPDDVKALAFKGLKVLLLGYKEIRRGATYMGSERNRCIAERNRRWLAANLSNMMSAFDVLSFDNLALTQLPVRKTVGEDVWRELYMGDDGRHTFFIDMVEGEYARSSVSMDRHAIGSSSVDDMFSVVMAEKDAEDSIGFPARGASGADLGGEA